MQYQSQGIKILNGKKTINQLLKTKSDNILISGKFLLFYQFIGNGNHLIALITTENK